MNKDSDLRFIVKTNHPMLRQSGSFDSYRNYYFAFMGGVQMTINEQLLAFIDISMLLREYHLKHLN
jgi:hypothetical protein